MCVRSYISFNALYMAALKPPWCPGDGLLQLCWGSHLCDRKKTCVLQWKNGCFFELCPDPGWHWCPVENNVCSGACDLPGVGWNRDWAGCYCLCACSPVVGIRWVTNWPWHWGKAAASLLKAPMAWQTLPGGQAKLLAVTCEELANKASLCPAVGQYCSRGKWGLQ